MTLNQRSTIPPHNFLQRRWPTTATARTSKIASSLCQPVSLHSIWISLLLELRSSDTCTCSPCPSSSTVSSTCWLLSPYLSCTFSCAKMDAQNKRMHLHDTYPREIAVSLVYRLRSRVARLIIVSGCHTQPTLLSTTTCTSFRSVSPFVIELFHLQSPLSWLLSTIAIFLHNFLLQWVLYGLYDE